jgi:integrase
MAQEIDFTNRTIEAIKPPESGRLEFKDTKTPGLYLRVSSSGVKTFSFVGRAKGSSRVERATFGKFPTVKPDEARRKAVVLAGSLADGKSAAKAARERRGELTLAELFKDYKAALEARNRKTTAELERMWSAHIEPAFGTRRLSEVSGRDVERWHSALPAQIVAKREAEAAARQAARLARRAAIEAAQGERRRGPAPKPRNEAATTSRVTGHTAANRALELLRAMYNWAGEARRELFTGTNPAAGHDKYREEQRERFLQPDELAPFFAALAAEPNQDIRDFVIASVLTGARRSNVIAMQWADVDLKRAEWRVRGEQMKNGQPQTITLTPELVQVLKQRRKDNPKGAWVFPSDKSESGHLMEPRAGWRRILQRAELSDLRLHDLRRTLGSWQARTGASLVLIGKSLNHRSQDATAIYARLDLDPVRQSVNRATSAMFEAAGIKDAAKVIALPLKSEAAPAEKSKNRA